MSWSSIKYKEQWHWIIYIIYTFVICYIAHYFLFVFYTIFIYCIVIYMKCKTSFCNINSDSLFYVKYVTPNTFMGWNYTRCYLPFIKCYCPCTLGYIFDFTTKYIHHLFHFLNFEHLYQSRVYVWVSLCTVIIVDMWQDVMSNIFWGACQYGCKHQGHTITIIIKPNFQEMHIFSAFN